jgi:hypothetical protein
MKWSDLELEVYLCQYTSFLTITCDSASVGTAVCNDGAEFTTGPRGEQDLSCDYDLTLTTDQAKEVVEFCNVAPYTVVFQTKGSVDAQLKNGHKFGEQSLDQLAYVYCKP